MISYTEARGLERGDCFNFNGRSQRVLSSVYKIGGGVGMGEYPSSVTITCASGLVLDVGPEGWYQEGKHCRVVHRESDT